MEPDEDELKHDDGFINAGVCPQCCSSSLMWDTGKLVCLACGYEIEASDE